MTVYFDHQDWQKCWIVVEMIWRGFMTGLQCGKFATLTRDGMNYGCSKSTLEPG